MAKSKLEQYNQSFKKAIGSVIYKLIPNIPSFTVTDVLIDPSLRTGRVWVRTTPEGFKLIEEKRVDIQNNIKRFVKTRYTPKLSFVADDRYLDHLDNLFSEVESEKPVEVDED